MSNKTLKLDINQINEMLTFYENFFVDNVNEYIIAIAKVNDCKITFYKTLKVLFQGNENSINFEYNFWCERFKIENIEKDTTNLTITYTHIGSDEVGCGDYFGPIVVASAIVRDNQYMKVKQLGVKDSKLLTDAKISEIAKELIKVIDYQVVILTPAKYNQLANDNLNYVKAILHNDAIVKLRAKKDEYHNIPAIIDQFARLSNFKKYLENVKVKADNVTLIEKGESYALAVASASIIARYAYLKQMEKLETEYNFSFPKGSGKAVDDAAKEFVKRYGNEKLAEVAKLKFKNTERIIE